MWRRVHFAKAVAAGAAGALAWEAAARALIALGVPLFDIVHVLGTIPGDAPWWRWWAIGATAHLALGAVWAVFYAYVAWSVLGGPPWRQGLVFSVVPMLLAGLVMVPRFAALHPALPPPGWFAIAFGLGGPCGIVIGHLLYGAVLGAVYRAPVGAPVAREARSRPSAGPPPPRPRALPPRDGRFLFATGIEGSYPTIEGGRRRFDQMEVNGHYRRWRDDIGLVRALGVSHLRWGPPLYRTFLGPGRYDWGGGSATTCFRRCPSAASSRSSISATSACRRGSGTSRTRSSRRCSPSTPARSPGAIRGSGSTPR
jgi:hypothetical protein